jgi:hypothetical protein
MTERFVLRPDPAGFSVIDTWSGEPAMIAQAAQTGLSEIDARHTATLLNQRQVGSAPQAEVLASRPRDRL